MQGTVAHVQKTQQTHQTLNNDIQLYKSMKDQAQTLKNEALKAKESVERNYMGKCMLLLNTKKGMYVCIYTYMYMY